MSFLVILLVLWVEKFSAWRLRIQQDGPWLTQLQRLQQGGLQQAPWLCLAILVLLPVLALGLVLLILKPLAYGWLALPVPSRAIDRATSVSAVRRLTLAARIVKHPCERDGAMR